MTYQVPHKRYLQHRAPGARTEKPAKTIGNFREEIYYTDVCLSTNPEDFLTSFTIRG
jgi:hypothetical protein